MSRILALDIGGANIKLADGAGYAVSHPFALWKSPEKLSGQLSQCLAAAPPHERIVVTMTGELCDCYATKSQGVKHIVTATMDAASGKPVLFYQTTGQFVSTDEATQNYLLTAASNWHALASFAACYCEGHPSILIDVGSTTTDLIPLADDREAALGRTDSERLLAGELIYMGVERSPVCAVVSRLPWQGVSCPVARELFATTADAYLLLGELSEDATDRNTADGQPLTVEAAHARLARMICGDSTLVTREEAIHFAESICDAQLAMLETALEQVVATMTGKPLLLILSGHGEFLTRRLLQRLGWSGRAISLTEKLGPEISRCATAHALAVLASETT